MRKMLWIFLALALIIGAQAGAKVGTMTGVESQVIAVDNAEIPQAPPVQFGATDDVVFFEDFESGAAGWEYVDLTDVSSWHVDDFNAYSGNSWWAGDEEIGGYDNHWLQYLVSPSIDLSGATAPALDFKLFYAVEELSGGYPAPYDGWDGCNVWISTNGGTTWDVLDMLTPAYTCTSMYSFGEEWGMGPGIGGWGGFSGGVSPGQWVDASADLSGYTMSNVKLRWALCSDPVWCTLDDPLLTGYFIDNVLVSEGATVYLENDADGVATPSDLIPTPNAPPTGNFWHVSTPLFPPPPSPTHVMEMSNGAGSYVPDIYNAVVSPVIDLTMYHPDSGSVFGDFYLYGSINVGDPDPFPNLDNYTVQIRPVGETAWFYYSNPWGSPGGTNYVLTTLPSIYDLWSNVNTEGVLNLTPYAGYEIQLRIIFQSDPDNYFGQGIFVDDFIVEFTSALEHDVSAELMHVPMPTSLYFSDIPCSVELHNNGLNDEPMIPAFWRENYAPNPLIPWANIPAGGMELKTWNWVPTGGVGSYFMDSYTMLTGDLDLSNDTSKAGLVDVTPADILEFGYDARQYSYEPSIYYFNFETGEGAYIRYTPTEDGVTENLNALSLRGLWRETGTIRIHIYGEGTPTTPGAQITQFDQAITTIYPSWNEIDISTIPELQGFNHEVWVFYELLNALGEPHLYGHDYSNFGEGHMFADFGTGMAQSEYDFYGRLVCEPAEGYPSWTIDTWLNGGSPVPPEGGDLLWGVFAENTSGQVLNGDVWVDAVYEGTTTMMLIERALVNYQPGWTINRPENYYPVPGGWPGGNYQWFVRTGVLPGTIWEEASFDWSKSGDVDLDYDFMANLPTASFPNPFDEITKTTTDVTVPTEYAVAGVYPNPFNPTTNLSFALPQSSRVLLNVYDVSGRLVTTLVDGYRTAGVHDVTFDASQLASGLYLYRLEAGDFNATGKMVLMK